jgi:hypothetical protein
VTTEGAYVVRWMIVAGEPDAHCVTPENGGRRGWRPLCQQSDMASDALLREARDAEDTFCGTCRQVFASRIRHAVARRRRLAQKGEEQR